ncbi:A-kinase anchor protein 7 isoforms alpha and beta-like [Tenrec ecaudatus]|uniref:A-kinase anchor protein 7 isoforms alpha and beta-like n=1 Tax=Tenrec ecaudatus TaxID=94439 RepID=UPI003F5A676F
MVMTAHLSTQQSPKLTPVETNWFFTMGAKSGGELDDAELVRLSKRLVENAVLKAVQQYLEETQNKNKPGDGSSGKPEEADRNARDSDNNRK